jgi:PAS domain S-box-containing protein
MRSYLRTWALILCFATLGWFASPNLRAQETTPTVETADLPKVVLQLKWFHRFAFAGYYAAQEKGFYREAGLDVELREGKLGLDLIGELISGRVDFLVSTTYPLVEYTRGKPVVLLAAIQQHSPKIGIALTDSGIKTPADAIGKRVMYNPDTEAEFMDIFLSEGIPLDRLIRVPHNWRFDDLIQGNVDVMSADMTDAPYQMSKRGAEVNIIRSNYYTADFYGDCLYTTRRQIQQDPERVRAFREASIRGWEYALGHQGEIIDLILERYTPNRDRGLLEYEAQSLRGLILPNLVQIGHINPNRWDHIADTYVKTGFIQPGGKTLEQFFYSPDTPPDQRWLLWTIGISLSALLVITGTATLLYVFNRRLRRAVERRTLELARTNRDLRQEIQKYEEAQKALIESECNYREVFNASSEAIFILDAGAQTCLDVNQTTLSLFLCERDEALRLTLNDLVPEDDTESSLDSWKMNIRNADDKSISVFESKIRKPNGEVFWAEIALRLSEIGGKQCVLVAIRDVRRRKQAETLLKRERDFNSTVLQTVQALVWVLDTCGNVVLFNHACETCTGYSSLDLLGKPFWDFLIPPDEKKVVRAVFENSDTIGQTAMYRNHWLAKNGQKRLIDWCKSAIKGPEGTVEYMIGAGVDVTEKTTLESQLRQAQKMEAVGQLAGGVAHDFNNLLQGIQGYIYLAMEDLTLRPQTRDHLQEVTIAADRAATLVRQLLTFSRRDALRSMPLDLNDTIVGLLKMIRRVIGEHIELNVVSGPRLRKVQADPGQIEQVLMNLCVNARDAMPQGGTISIETENVSLDFAFCEQNAWARPGDYVQLSVTDTGLGMSPEIKDRIFEPFFTTKEIGQGTGLGLATVYGIVHGHDGLISVSSEAGQGSSFRIYLPILPLSEDETAAVHLKTLTPPAGGTETLLLAEDEEHVRGVAVRILERAGYHLLVACDGQEAVELFHQNADRVNLALLDVVMPRLNGPATCDAIRALRPELPVIFLTGYSRQYLGEDFSPTNKTGLLQKPYGPRDMLRAIRQMLDTQE